MALDLGSSTVTALVCEASETGRLELRGSGVADSKGFRRDQLVDLQAAVESITRAAEAAERSSGLPLESATVGVAGSHLRGLNSRGGVSLGARPREVLGDDMRRAIEAARAITLPAEQELLHVLPQEFLLDQQNGLRDPRGLLGRRLEVNVHIVAADSTAVQNLITAVNRAGLVVENTVFEPLAAAEACLTADERELGVLLADFGGGSTDWILIEHGAPRASGLIPVGGEHFTSDIAIVLRTPLWEAERVKRAYGCASFRSLTQDALFEVASMGERPARVTSRRALCEILEPRALEWLALLREALESSGPGRLPASGVVLTGGAAQLEGLVELAGQALGIPVRLGLAKGLAAASGTLANPACATAVGLVLHAHRWRQARRQEPASLVGRVRDFFTGRVWAAGA
jgi:cell division protein FtsA